MAPLTGGVGLGWLCELLLDVFRRSVLGNHALVLSLATYFIVHEASLILGRLPPPSSPDGVSLVSGTRLLGREI